LEQRSPKRSKPLATVGSPEHDPVAFTNATVLKQRCEALRACEQLAVTPADGSVAARKDAGMVTLIA